MDSSCRGGGRTCITAPVTRPPARRRSCDLAALASHDQAILPVPRSSVCPGRPMTRVPAGGAGARWQLQQASALRKVVKASPLDEAERGPGDRRETPRDAPAPAEPHRVAMLTVGGLLGLA